MLPTVSTQPQEAPNSLEFEVTAVSEARRKLEELPPGVDSLPTLIPGYWERFRRTRLPTDIALTGATIEWLLRLPARARPRVLCERYPRIANAIASAWQEPNDRRAMLDELLVDRRGGRRGFPVKVREEIEMLRMLAQPR
jgi:hypothetical protein